MAPAAFSGGVPPSMWYVVRAARLVGTRGCLPPAAPVWLVLQIGLAMVNDEGEVVVGVMGLPNWSGEGLVLSAIRGQGTWRHYPRQPGQARAAVRVDSAGEWESARVCISDHEEWARLPLARGLKEGCECVEVLPLCCGSLCKYAAVAMGKASVFVQHPISTANLKVWDHAAGVICVEEAGGKVRRLVASTLPDLTAHIPIRSRTSSERGYQWAVGNEHSLLVEVGWLFPMTYYTHHR